MEFPVSGNFCCQTGSDNDKCILCICVTEEMFLLSCVFCNCGRKFFSGGVWSLLQLYTSTPDVKKTSVQSTTRFPFPEVEGFSTLGILSVHFCLCVCLWLYTTVCVCGWESFSHITALIYSLLRPFPTGYVVFI